MTPECRNCGGFATDRFAAVFGDNQDRIYRCLGCATAAELKDGHATEPNAEPIPP